MIPSWIVTGFVTGIAGGLFALIGAGINRILGVSWGRYLTVVGIAAGLTLSRYATPFFEAALWTNADTEKLLAQANSRPLQGMADALPAEYAAVIQRITDGRRAGATERQMIDAVYEVLTDTRQRYASQALLASDANIVLMLVSTMHLHEEVYARWGSDCGHFAMEGGIYLVRSGKAASVREQLDDTSVLFYRLLKDARESPVQRTAASEDDYTALGDLMTSRGISEADFQLIAQPDVSDPNLCPALVRFIEAALELPDPAGSRVRADILKSMMGT